MLWKLVSTNVYGAIILNLFLISMPSLMLNKYFAKVSDLLTIYINDPENASVNSLKMLR